MTFIRKLETSLMVPFQINFKGLEDYLYEIFTRKCFFFLKIDFSYILDFWFKSYNQRHLGLNIQYFHIFKPRMYTIYSHCRYDF